MLTLNRMTQKQQNTVMSKPQDEVADPKKSGTLRIRPEVADMVVEIARNRGVSVAKLFEEWVPQAKIEDLLAKSLEQKLERLNREANEIRKAIKKRDG